MDNRYFLLYKWVYDGLVEAFGEFRVHKEASTDFGAHVRFRVLRSEDDDEGVFVAPKRYSHFDANAMDEAARNEWLAEQIQRIKSLFGEPPLPPTQSDQTG